MRVKSCPVTVKAAGDDKGDSGVFEAIVATWDLDSVGDKITQGAFAETLADWAERAGKGQPLPVIWSHMHQDPNMHVGWVLDAKETDEGLWVKAQIDLEAPAPSNAGTVHRLLKGGRVSQFSFAYDVLDGAWIDKVEDGVDESYYELSRLKLYEVGPTLIGANQATELLDVKSHDGRPLEVAITGLSAAKSAHVRAAVLAALDAVDQRPAGKAGQPAGPPAPPAAGAPPADVAGAVVAAAAALTEAVKALVPQTPTGAPPAGHTATDQARQPAPPSASTEAPAGGKADDGSTGSASARLRFDLELSELEASLT